MLHTLAQLAAFFLLALLVFAPLERIFAARPQSLLRPAFWTDVGYFVLNGIVPNLLLILPLSAMAWAVHRAFPSAYFQHIAALPIGIRLLAALIAGDLGYYWAHRWMHENAFLWRFHAIHHSAEQMDWLVNTRSHPIDVVFGRLCSYSPLYALGLFQPTGLHADIVPLLFMLIGKLWSYLIHANLRGRWGWMEAIVATPAFHHWHHTNDGPAVVNKNYAAMIPALDRLFGTHHLPASLPVQYGIDTPLPQDIAGQLLYPVLPSASPASSAARAG